MSKLMKILVWIQQLQIQKLQMQHIRIIVSVVVVSVADEVVGGGLMVV
jgi:hypothetical protein